MNYEEKMKRLEDVIKELENDIPMDIALELFKEGSGLVKDCLNHLEETKGSVYKVKQELQTYKETKIGK